MVGDARTIGQLDTTRVLRSKWSTSPIDQQPFSGRLFHSQTPKLAKSSAIQSLPLFTLNERIISWLSCALHNCIPALRAIPRCYIARDAAEQPDAYPKALKARASRVPPHPAACALKSFL